MLPQVSHSVGFKNCYFKIFFKHAEVYEGEITFSDRFKKLPFQNVPLTMVSEVREGNNAAAFEIFFS